jgi:hypothetical protein
MVGGEIITLNSRKSIGWPEIGAAGKECIASASVLAV